MRLPTASSIALAGIIGLTSAARAQAPEAGSGPAVPGGEYLLAWLGWDVGQTLTYQGSGGERYCVRVGRPRNLQGSVWVALDGLPWPSLATDSRILLPHDGTLGLGVIRTPGPRPFVEALHGARSGTLTFMEGLTPDQALAVPLEDGWYAFGNSAGAPTTLVYVWCTSCADAGAVVRLERGRGIVSIAETTIRGTDRLELIHEACDLPEVEFEVYVEPAPGREP